jgi:hypothetical protein
MHARQARFPGAHASGVVGTRLIGPAPRSPLASSRALAAPAAAALATGAGAAARGFSARPYTESGSLQGGAGACPGGRARARRPSAHVSQLAGRRQVAAFRTWLDKRGGGGPTPLAAGPLPPPPTKAEIFDRYTQHTQFCPSCMAVRAPWTDRSVARACADVLTCQ